MWTGMLCCLLPVVGVAPALVTPPKTLSQETFVFSVISLRCVFFCLWYGNFNNSNTHVPVQPVPQPGYGRRPCVEWPSSRHWRNYNDCRFISKNLRSWSSWKRKWIPWTNWSQEWLQCMASIWDGNNLYLGAVPELNSSICCFGNIVWFLNCYAKFFSSLWSIGACMECYFDTVSIMYVCIAFQL